MKILLTGGNGFIGKNILAQLGRKYEIFAPSHRKLDIKNYVKVKKYIEKNKIDIIIHSAVVSRENDIEQNLRMFESIIHNADKVKRIIHFGSGAEYAKNRNFKKIKEDEWGQFIPDDSYGFSKFTIHEISKNFDNIVNLRLFGIYGIHENYLTKFISNSISKNIFGLPIKIKQNVVFDYLYIDDLMPILDFFINNNAQHADYNITPDKSVSLLEVAQIINKVSNRKSAIQIANDGLNFEYTANNFRLKSEIGTYRFTTYEDGVLKLYDYLKKNRNYLSKKLLIEDRYFKTSKISKRK